MNKFIEGFAVSGKDCIEQDEYAYCPECGSPITGTVTQRWYDVPLVLNEYGLDYTADDCDDSYSEWQVTNIKCNNCNWRPT